MYTFYFAKGSSALAPHILLGEIGVEYDTVEISIPKGDHLKPEFLAVNPRARVPALKTPHGMLSENMAILPWLAGTVPDKGLAPTEPFAVARATEFCAYLAATGHVNFAHKLRGTRWVEPGDTVALEAMAAKVPANMGDVATLIEDHMFVGPWALGDSYSYVDCYLFLLQRWLSVAGVDIAAWPKLAAHAEAMRARPATQAALAAHGLS